MRIATRLTLTLAGVALAGGVVYGAYSVPAERDELRRAVAHEVGLLGRTLQAALEASGGAERATEALLATLDDLSPPVAAVIIDAAGRERARVGPSPPDAAARADAARAGADVGVDFTQHHAVTALALADGGALVVARPTRDVDAALRAALGQTGLVALGLVVLAAAVGFALGRVYVVRPLERLGAAMEAVRSGDLDATVGLARRDEMGAAVDAFNAMTAELRQTRARLLAEGEARRALERGLQHADMLVTVGELAAALAHDLGSPLQVLAGRARLLDRAAEDPERVRRHARILVEQTDHVARIVEELVSVARRRPPRRVRTDLPGVVATVVELLGFEARRQGVELVVDAPPGLPAVWVDPDQMQQVVLNLMRNALAFCPRGGRVVASLEAVALGPPQAEPNTPAVRLTVRDDGPGVPPEARARVFEPFFTTRVDDGGTGLGLAAVRGVTVAHGGKVAVEDGPGGAFSVTVPVGGGA